MLRWLRRLIAVGLALTLLLPATLVVAAPDFSFAGRGWGHGVGLSQYGAKAMGADGATHQDVISRYFTGVNLAAYSSAAPDTFLANEPLPLWVGLLQHSDSVSFRVENGRAELCFDIIDYCPVSATDGETWRYGPDGTGGCVFLRHNADGTTATIGGISDCAASVRPLTTGTRIHVPYKARTYGGGVLRFRQAPLSKKVHTVYQVDVPAYMRGLALVPESWAPAALRAQAITSRSNALWYVLERGSEGTFDQRRMEECHCNLRDSDPDQVFQGQTGDLRHPNWVGAVSATAGLVMGWGTTIALGEFSSSSGGWTESYVSVFGSAEHPYLVSANDGPAYSDTADNPHRTWLSGTDQVVLAELFEFSWVSNAEVATRNPSGSAKTVVLTGIRNGHAAQTTVSGVALRSALSLRSTTFDISVRPRYSDVSPTSLFAGEVLGLDVLGITTGCTATAFCPGDPVTRGEMAAFLVRALSLPAATVRDTFDDDDGSFFEADIEALALAGITTGCETGRFCTDQMVTRGEMATFLVRGFALASAAGNTFDDDDGSVFEADIEALRTRGITNGCTPTSYCPDRPVTREQMAAFLVRALSED